MLKLCPPNILLSINKIFNATLDIGLIPSSWKLSKVIMIHKNNKPKDNFSSYRPISLISCISKLLEKIINNRLVDWTEQNKILPHCQSGFRKKKSCQDHIARFNQYITEGFNNKQHTGCVLFDLEKAFDKASHQGILHKLQKSHLPPSLFNWIQDFLTDRPYLISWNSQLKQIHNKKWSPTRQLHISHPLQHLFQ